MVFSAPQTVPDGIIAKAESELVRADNELPRLPVLCRRRGQYCRRRCCCSMACEQVKGGRHLVSVWHVWEYKMVWFP